MSQVVVVVKMPLKPGTKQQAIEGFNVALKNVANEDGTVQYILHENPANENELWVYELYANQDAFQAHVGSDWFKAFVPDLFAVLDGNADMTFLTPLVGKGL